MRSAAIVRMPSGSGPSAGSRRTRAGCCRRSRRGPGRTAPSAARRSRGSAASRPSSGCGRAARRAMRRKRPRRPSGPRARRTAGARPPREGAATKRASFGQRARSSSVGSLSTRWNPCASTCFRRRSRRNAGSDSTVVRRSSSATASRGTTFAALSPTLAEARPRTLSDGYWSDSWYVAPTFSGCAMPMRAFSAVSSSGTSARTFRSASVRCVRP